MVVVKEIKPFTGFTFQGPRRCGLSGGKAAACSPTQIGYAALRFLRRSADKIGLRCTSVPASGLDRTQKTQVRFRIHLNGFIAQPAAIETAGYGGELISWPVNPAILCYNRTIMQKRMV